MRQPPQRSLFVATICLLLIAAGAIWLLQKQKVQTIEPGPVTLDAVARQVLEIEAAEARADQTTWAQERLAEQCGRVIEDFWDRLNASTNKLETVGALPVEEIQRPTFGSAETLPHGIQLLAQTGAKETWGTDAWKEQLAAAARAGWQLTQTEFRHLEFDTDAQGRPNRSRYYWSGHWVNPRNSERAIIEGQLHVFWNPGVTAGEKPAIRRIEPTDLSIRTRLGAPPFREILNRPYTPLNGSYFIDPLILYDLDGDGRSEIILAAKNLVLQRQADGTFQERPLCEHSPGLIFTGIIADFDGDGTPDFLCAKFEGLWLFKGAPGGIFAEAGRLVWAANPHLRYAQTVTCGDIDGDGDLDIWLGQYKVPYDRGQMPTPFYDANDGFPSYLLLNDGRGNFTDATVSAGLGTKRWRRAYSASFVDLNQDEHLDLVVANDFAGLEIYANDGRGQFKDVTDAWIPERRSFGMAQLCADFDCDGRTDLLLVGMNVPTMDRLRHAGRARPGHEDYLDMGARIASGNRLFQGLSSDRFQQTTLNEKIARTGWSWGASAADFDNDGFPDLYVANGHETKQSVRDYETEFWLHDIYVGNSKDNLPAFAYFRSKSERTRGRGMSYGGYERNRMFFNRSGKEFVEAAHLMGVALPEDSRNVVADDLDGDGRMDLVVTTFETWPERRQTLRIFANELAQVGHWIGFRLHEQGAGLTPAGARITVHSGAKVWVQQLITGDSYRSQQSNSAHFGLGEVTQVDWAEVHYSNGRSVVLQHPAVDRYHIVTGKGE